jgi:hypothetical protein
MSKSIIFNGYLITRREYYGFRCNNPSIEWDVYKPGGLDSAATLIGTYHKLKWAKEHIEKGHADRDFQLIQQAQALRLATV